MIHTEIRFAVHPADQNRVRQLDGISSRPATRIPEPGEVIEHPLLVAPDTLLPIPLIVADVLHDYSPDYVVVVLTLPH